MRDKFTREIRFLTVVRFGQCASYLAGARTLADFPARRFIEMQPTIGEQDTNGQRIVWPFLLVDGFPPHLRGKWTECDLRNSFGLNFSLVSSRNFSSLALYISVHFPKYILFRSGRTRRGLSRVLLPKFIYET